MPAGRNHITILHRMRSHHLTRRDFLKLASLGLSGLAFRPFIRLALPEFSKADSLGRVTVGKVDVFIRPDSDSPVIGVLYEDSVVPWIRETVGIMSGRINQRWVETPFGFVWGGNLQPVLNQPNTAISVLPATSLGQGMWVEVTVPYVDLILANPPSRAPWLQYRESFGLPARFMYSQVVWMDQIRTDEAGKIWYRLNEKYGW
jgi:hypothetical protein